LGASGRLVVDRRGPGRGAWLCKLGGPELAQPDCINPDCINKAVRRRAFNRALRAEVNERDVELLLAMASEHARIDRTRGSAAEGRYGQDRERD
jgi:predicted RNA-binding protein YlxR (DUF448 family)